LSLVLTIDNFALVKMATSGPARARPDGRQLRSVRTREAVARSMLALLEQGNLRPTAREVAAHAGVSERAVFRHFQDLESLLGAVSDIHAARIASLAPALAPADAPLAERLDRFVQRWCTVYEIITPVRRAAMLRAPFSEEIRARHQWMRGLRFEELCAALGLTRAQASEERGANLLAAMRGVVSWSFWENLRAHQGLSRDRAIHVVRSALDGLLTARERSR